MVRVVGKEGALGGRWGWVGGGLIGATAWMDRIYYEGIDYLVNITR